MPLRCVGRAVPLLFGVGAGSSHVFWPAACAGLRNWGRGCVLLSCLPLRLLRGVHVRAPRYG
eukprot:15462907-Alexandrium_andersonii.AAC.1